MAGNQENLGVFGSGLRNLNPLSPDGSGPDVS